MIRVKLQEFVNLQDERQLVLLMVYVVACLIPAVPHPILVLHGPQGSAKTTLFRVLGRLIDPSALETLALGRDYAQPAQQLAHHWAPFFDNVTHIQDHISDALCRAATGEGFVKRELFTDDEDVIYRYRRCVGLNGINVAAQRPDLLDRCIVLGLEPIAVHSRRSEQEFWHEFESARPALVGAMFRALSAAMLRRPAIHLTGLHRMADFTVWGRAIADALGFDQDDFLSAYYGNLTARNDEVISGHPVATAVMALMHPKTTWQGSPTELLDELVPVATECRIDLGARSWPKGPHWLTRRLNEVQTNLAAAGIQVSTDRDAPKRTITLQKVAPNAVIGVTHVSQLAQPAERDAEWLKKGDAREAVQ